MKKISIGIMLILALCMTANVALAAAGKMGFVDLSRLFDEYYKTKEFDKVLEAKHKDFEAKSKTKVEGIKEKQSKLALMKEAEKAKLQEEIETLKAELLEFDRQQKTTLTKERNEKIREILLEIEKIVSDYAEKEKFDLILNDRVLIYGNQTIDLTEQILEKLNSK